MSNIGSWCWLVIKSNKPNLNIDCRPEQHAAATVCLVCLPSMLCPGPMHSVLHIHTVLLVVLGAAAEDMQPNNTHGLANGLPLQHNEVLNLTSTRDENHPMMKVMETAPHSMSLMIKPRDYKPDTMIRLLYERVPLNKGPFLLHLDDPVIEFIPLIRRAQSYTLSELPMGKYIVCGEAMVMGEVYQSSCFETRIERLDNNSQFQKNIFNKI